MGPHRGKPVHLAQRSAPFKWVFDATQNFINDVSFCSNEAPRNLPRMDSLADLKKGPVSSTNDMAIAVPILKGTLSWGCDEDGVSVCIEVLQTRSWVSRVVWPRNDRGRWGTDQALRCMTAPG